MIMSSSPSSCQSFHAWPSGLVRISTCTEVRSGVSAHQCGATIREGHRRTGRTRCKDALARTGRESKVALKAGFFGAGLVALVLAYP